MIREDSIQISDSARVHPTATIGCEPFSYQRPFSKIGIKIGKLTRKPGTFGIIIEDNVDIGPHTSIQLGTKQPTIIGKGSIVNAGAHIGHDVQIGKRCTIGLGSTISGFTTIGDGSTIGPGCTISNRLTIGKRVTIRIGSLVVHNIPDGWDVIGRPAIPFKIFRERRKQMKELLGVDGKETL